jgi:hypothetical protein
MTLARRPSPPGVPVTLRSATDRLFETVGSVKQG